MFSSSLQVRPTQDFGLTLRVIGIPIRRGFFAQLFLFLLTFVFELVGNFSLFLCSKEIFSCHSMRLRWIASSFFSVKSKWQVLHSCASNSSIIVMQTGALDRVGSVDCQHGFFFNRFQFHSLTDDHVQTQIAEVMLRIFALVLGAFLGHNGLRTLSQGLNQALDFVFRQVVIQAGMDAFPIRVRRIGNVYVKIFLFVSLISHRVFRLRQPNGFSLRFCYCV